MIRGLKQDYWMAILLLAGFVAMLGLVLRDYGVGLPEFPTPSARPDAIVPPVNATNFAGLFSTEPIAELLPQADLPTPFFTAHFQPPRPKPPTTRRVNMTYLGFLESAEGERRAFLQVDKETRITTLGELIVADLALAGIHLNTLTLTNNAAETNLLQFNVPKAIQVPIP